MFRLPHTRKHILLWVPIVVIVFFALMFSSLIVFFRMEKERAQEVPMHLGVTFSTIYAEELGLDWKEVYDALIDDLGVRYLRVPIYWSEIEATPGEYDFTKFDYIVQRAEDVGAEIIAVVGRRQPRWPECHVPVWALSHSEAVQRTNMLASVQATVEHFRDSPAVTVWQVENEPLLSIFGECPEPDLDLLRDEVTLVKSLDPTRPIMLTESGELSTWLRLTHLADWIGVSMYRVTWNEVYGYWIYPLTPRFYANKAALISPVTDRVIVSELQAEPWLREDVHIQPLEDQYHSMNPDILRKNVRFARETGLGSSLLWGVEWWYWLREVHGEAEMWDTAREIFAIQQH